MLNYGMGLTISAFDQVTHVIRSIEGVIKGLERTSGRTFGLTEKSLGKLTGGIALAGAGMAGIGATWNLAKQAAEVEKGLAGVHILTQASKEEMAQLEKFAMRTGAAMGVMPLEAIEAMDVLGTQNVKADRMLKMLPTIFKFTKANAGLSSEAATNILTQASTMFALNQEEFDISADQIQKALDIFKMKAADLELLFARGSSGVTLTQAYLTDYLAIAGSIKDLLPSPMIAGTGASYMLKELTERKNRVQIKEKLGVDVLDGMGGMRAPENILKDLYKAVEHMPTIELKDFFGSVFNETGLQAIVAYFQRMKTGFEDNERVWHKGLDGIEYSWSQIAGSMGNLDAAFEERMNTFTGQMDIASARWKSFTEELGKPMAKAWRPFVEAWGGVLTSIQNAFGKLSPEVQGAVADFAIWGSIFAVIAGIGGTIVFLWPMLSLVLGGIAAGMGSFLVGAWPVVAVLLAIYAAWWAISNNIGGMGDMWTKATDGIGAAFGNMVSQLMMIWSSMWAGFKEGFGWIAESGIFGILRDSIGHLVASIKELWASFTVGEKAAGVFKYLGMAIGFVTGVAAMFISVFVSVLVELASWIITITGGILHFIGMIFDGVMKVINVIGRGWGAVKKFFGGTETAEAPPNKVEELWSSSDGKTASDAEESTSAPQNASNSADFVPLAKMTMPVGDNASGYYEGVVPAGSESKDPINYDKLAEACSKQPLYCVFDGQKIVGYIKRAEEMDKSLGNR